MSTIKNRIFIVGSPRSGTTLLQALLASHSQIHTFPESHFFYALMQTGKMKRLLRLANVEVVNKRMIQFLKECNRDDLHHLLLPKHLFYQSQIKAFIQILDTIASESGKNSWVEKTPLHLHFIKIIQQYIPQSKFIHIIRNGLDVIASTFEVTQNHPEQWGGKRSIAQCTDRWITDIRLSSNHIEEDNHFFIRYENLIKNPELSIKKALTFLDLPFEEELLTNYTNHTDSFVLDQETWKKNVSKSILKDNRKKASSIFGSNEILQIQEKIGTIDLSIFNHRI